MRSPGPLFRDRSLRPVKPPAAERKPWARAFDNGLLALWPIYGCAIWWHWSNATRAIIFMFLLGMTIMKRVLR